MSSTSWCSHLQSKEINKIQSKAFLAFTLGFWKAMTKALESTRKHNKVICQGLGRMLDHMVLAGTSWAPEGLETEFGHISSQPWCPIKSPEHSLGQLSWVAIFHPWLRREKTTECLAPFWTLPYALFPLADLDLYPYLWQIATRNRMVLVSSMSLSSKLSNQRAV